jgi:hypothetical protein
VVHNQATWDAKGSLEPTGSRLTWATYQNKKKI